MQETDKPVHGASPVEASSQTDHPDLNPLSVGEAVAQRKEPARVAVGQDGAGETAAINPELLHLMRENSDAALTSLLGLCPPDSDVARACRAVLRERQAEAQQRSGAERCYGPEGVELSSCQRCGGMVVRYGTWSVFCHRCGMPFCPNCGTETYTVGQACSICSDRE